MCDSLPHFCKHRCVGFNMTVFPSTSPWDWIGPEPVPLGRLLLLYTRRAHHRQTSSSAQAMPPITTLRPGRVKLQIFLLLKTVPVKCRTPPQAQASTPSATHPPCLSKKLAFPWHPPVILTPAPTTHLPPELQVLLHLDAHDGLGALSSALLKREGAGHSGGEGAGAWVSGIHGQGRAALKY
jgi:hypothetical protein